MSRFYTYSFELTTGGYLKVIRGETSEMVEGDPVAVAVPVETGYTRLSRVQLNELKGFLKDLDASEDPWLLGHPWKTIVWVDGKFYGFVFPEAEDNDLNNLMVRLIEYSPIDIIHDIRPLKDIPRFPTITKP